MRFASGHYIIDNNEGTMPLWSDVVRRYQIWHEWHGHMMLISTPSVLRSTILVHTPHLVQPTLQLDHIPGSQNAEDVLDMPVRCLFGSLIPFTKHSLLAIHTRGCQV